MAARAPDAAPIAACEPAPALPDVADSVDWKRGCWARNWGLATREAGRRAQRAANRAFWLACLENMVVLVCVFFSVNGMEEEIGEKLRKIWVC